VLELCMMLNEENIIGKQENRSIIIYFYLQSKHYLLNIFFKSKLMNKFNIELNSYLCNTCINLS
jgi:hypothetical protein